MRIKGVGYEGKTIDEFIAELLDAGIELLVDVRANPRSRKAGFGSNQLAIRCAEARIEYLGRPELGIPSETRRGANAVGRLSELLADYEKRLEGMQPVLASLKLFIDGKNAAIMCFERDETKCHRSVLLRKLRED